MISRLLLVAFFLSIGTNLNAQYSLAKAKDFADMQGRTLIVEQLELDERLIANWEKKKSKARKEEDANGYQRAIEKYKKFVSDYNEFIKQAVTEHWDINPDVIYKTHSEVNQLMKDDSEEYTVLWYAATDSKRKDEFGATYFPSLTVPTLKYSRIEKGRIKTDYCYFLHFTHDRDDEIKYTDLVLALRLMKQHMDFQVAEDKSKYTFHEYVLDQAKMNCKDLGGSEVFIQDGSVHKKTSLSEINGNYSGQVNTLTQEEIEAAILNGEDKLVGFFFPFNIVVGSIGPASMGRIQYVRSFVNTKTGTIYTSWGGKSGQFFDPYFRKREFEKYDECR